jgi:hypothetical protein
MFMAKLVCVNCQTELQPFHSGVYVIEMASFGPYKVWAADLWKCHGCGMEVVSGFSEQPIMEHYKEGFDEWFAKIKDEHADSIIYDYERPIKD